jgi:hypothetical protein
MFGKTLSKEMNVATEAMVNPTTAQDLQKTVRSDSSAKRDKAVSHANTMHGMSDDK